MRKIIHPTPKEDAAITAASLTDPDNQPLTDADFKRMKRVRGLQKSPTKKQVTMRFDADVLEALKTKGKGWQGRANSLLREALGI